MPSREPRTVDQAGPGGLRAVVIVIIAVAMVPVVLVAIFVALAVSSFSHIGERKHLKPIPVAAGACPFVKAMHEEATQLQAAQPFFGVGFDAHGGMLSWRQTRARLARAGARLEFSIAGGLPQFPPEVQHYLAEVRDKVHAGRAQLRAARDAPDLIRRTSSLWADGQAAFGFAGDLIGRQCGVQLGADDETTLTTSS